MRYATVVLIAASAVLFLGLPQMAMASDPTTTAVTNQAAVVWDTTIEAHRAGDTLADVPKWQQVDQMPTVKDQAHTVYPEDAMNKKLEAEVWVQALVGADGLVHRAHVTKKSAYPWEMGFEQSALVAALNSTYTPATAGGKPVAVWVTYPVKYKLQ
jgi:protein TonB